MSRKLYREYDKETGELIKLECSKCHEIKTADCFSKNKSRKDSVQSRCKQCCSGINRQYRENHKEEISERNRRWHENNKDKINEKHRQYYKNNKEEICEKQQEYYKNNKEKKINILSIIKIK